MFDSLVKLNHLSKDRRMKSSFSPLLKQCGHDVTAIVTSPATIAVIVRVMLMVTVTVTLTVMVTVMVTVTLKVMVTVMLRAMVTVMLTVMLTVAVTLTFMVTVTLSHGRGHNYSYGLRTSSRWLIYLIDSVVNNALFNQRNSHLHFKLNFLL